MQGNSKMGWFTIFKLRTFAFRKYNKMIEIGKYNTLIILRDTKVGLFLGTPETDPEGIHDILYPINMSQMNLK
jgi:hypothetical protein